jgi:mono/diheme cytochrome c family protein
VKFRAMGYISMVLLAAACSTAPTQHAPRAMSGMEMYQRLCASCHGVDARGAGSVASVLKTGVPDLTHLAYRDGGEFPTEDVRRAIDGRWDRAAHGARDMPVWGWQFYDISSSDEAQERATVDSMIERLVVYLQSIQSDVP